MKNLKITLTALALTSFSFGSFAADLVNNPPADQQEFGVITVSGASDLSTLEAGLSAKADAAGAKSFRITGAGGNNQLHGTAIIYK
ncbi:MAG: DUF1471 domain-containing protein [Serratia liquefaciens]|nr:DUF1471 domain-containing protein [Serratia liquefaciens]